MIEHDITIGGKPLRDHLEAVDHYSAVLWMRELAASTTGIGGVCSTLPRRIAGSPVVFPYAMKVPSLMKEYGEWLVGLPPVPAVCFDAHFRLVAIHPFVDGNGRTARLLMNLLLLRGGYPPVAVRPMDRKTYLDTLELASVREDLRPFQALLHQRLDATLADYLERLEGAPPSSE